MGQTAPGARSSRHDSLWLCHLEPGSFIVVLNLLIEGWQFVQYVGK